MQGKTLFISGGTRGIGKAIVYAFAQKGCDVAFTYASSADTANEIIADIEEKFNVNPNKISVIHNGIDMNFFYPKSKKEISEHVPMQFINAPYKIFSSSRLVKGKNIETLLRAIHLAKDELPGLVHLHLGAEGSQPKKTKEIKKLQEELGLNQISYFLGAKQKNELPSYYSWADTFILPTLWEGLSRVMRESLACGTPVIATNYGSSSEIVQNNFNGISIDPMNEEEIAESIVKIMKDKKFKNSLEKNARQSMDKYSLEKSMEMYSKLYGKLLK